MEWSGGQTNPNVSVVSTTSLYHQRLGWKVAVDLNPAPTAAGASTAVWKTAVEGTMDGGVMNITAGVTMEVVVEARDAHGNHRGVGEFTVEETGRIQA